MDPGTDPTRTSGKRTPRTADEFHRAWLSAAAVVAVSATTIDAILLQRKRAFFTGGFLSVDHIKSFTEGIVFVASSLATDAAVLGIAVALALWLCGRFGIGRAAAWALAVLAGLGPVGIADIVNYQLLTYLGDAFDFGLMFELAGRNPMEILAVTSSHLFTYALIAAVVAAFVIAALWWVIRRSRSAQALRVSLRHALLLPGLVLVVTGGATAFARVRSDVLDDGLKRKLSGHVIGVVAERLTDVDRDGFGMLGRVRDPNPFDGSINPYALDRPGNGVDEDGVAGDLPSGAGFFEEGPAQAPRWGSRKDVVLIVLESFRADAYGRRVEGHLVTPVLEALAARGVAARFAFSHNGYTVQSRRHIFTGSVADARGPSTLVDDFKANGYETGYFSGQDDSFGGPNESVGLERAEVRFDARSALSDRYTTFATPGSLAVPASVVLDRVNGFLATRDHKRPLFLYVNFHDTHFPYHHRGIAPIVSSETLDQFAIGPQRLDALRAMYYNTAANVDRAIGDLLQSVERSLGREFGVVVLSDHGESLYDGGFLGHGYALDEAQTRIPFIAAGLPLVVREPFAQSDLRDMLWQALDEPNESTAPRLDRAPGVRVFQYLGTVDRPAQIAFTWTDGQMVYDFRSGDVQVSPERWATPESLRGEKAETFRTLIHQWEAMKLARAKAGVRGGGS